MKINADAGLMQLAIILVILLIVQKDDVYHVLTIVIVKGIKMDNFV